eukprot:gnl/TRDRNA2_/TRDRNA2_86881_c1_seq1.p1 gnl/TRDRNA2_/TRDRNA2_86881_c1~~gnl/TRDRNA2_/TRDRNA2_86881_c1_seq1.p1  ORF type:complete len:132 (-),score=21.77 gnl/TRDRNA2_/TRDRNA2_86881_c1_seq1:69-428(-)
MSRQAQAVMVALQAARSLSPNEFIVSLNMSGHKSIGLELDWADGKTLYVRSLPKGGAIEEWNKKHSEETKVHPGDRIICVNGFSDGPMIMIHQLCTQSHLTLLIRGPPPPPAKSTNFVG